MKLIKTALIVCLLLIANVCTDPCDVASADNSLQFDENTQPGTILFRLPFAEPRHIQSIQMESSEFANLHELFSIIDFSKFKLNKHYDLEIYNDFIEIEFICQSKPLDNQIFRNTFLLYVTVNDVNDKIPEFVHTPYKFSVKELTPVGSVAFSGVKAVDKDMPNRPNSQISFSVVHGLCSQYFEFPLSTRPEIAVAKLINYNSLSACNLTIKAQDHGEPPLSSETTIQIKVIDIDDKDPVFDKNFYIGSIARNSRPGTMVNMSEPIFAFDQDFGINMTLEYSLNNNMFEIDKDTAVIYLKQKISNYDIKEFNFVVKSSQVDNQLRSCVSMVTIVVLDTNFYAPIFRSKLYKAEIVENCEQDTFVSQIQADDQDENRIQYSIENSHEFPFVIDKYSGVIRVNNRIDYEMKQAYEMQVKAFDGKFSDKSLVKIKILNVVDKAPSFEYNFYNFKIKIPYDVFIGQVKASDVEKTSNMTYSLDFLNRTDSNLFCVTQTGTIYLCSQQFDSKKDHIDQILLNFDQDEYTFNVTVKIYSDYLNNYLINSVECKIQIESKSIERVKSYQVRTSTTAFNRFEASDFFQNYLIKDFKDMSVFVILIALVLVFMIALFAILVWVKCRQIRTYRKKLNTSLSTGTKSSSDMSCGSSSSSEKGTDTPTMFLSDQSKITILSDYLNSSQNRRERVPRMSYYSDLLTSASNGQSSVSSPKLLSFLPPDDKKSFVFNQHEPLMLSAELNLENSKIYLNDSTKFQANLSNCNQSLVKLVNIMNSQTNSSVVSVSVDGKEYEDAYAVASDLHELDITSTSWLSSISSAKLTSVYSSMRSNASSLSLSKIKTNPNVYKLFFNMTREDSYLTEKDSEYEPVLNKVFFDKDNNESLAYV